MAQCSRFQSPPQPRNHYFHPPAPASSQSSLIDHLRRQNDFLRKQLEALINMRQTSSHGEHLRTPMVMRPTLNNHYNNEGEVADEVYRNKLSKIKMRKSPRNSMQMNVTTPNSPLKMREIVKNRKGEKMVETTYQKGEINNRNDKMIALTEESRYILRDQTNFPISNTPRKYQGHEQLYAKQSNTTTEPLHFNDHQTSRPPKPSHQRAESSYHPPVEHTLPTERYATIAQPPTKRNFPIAPMGLSRPYSKQLILPQNNFRTPVYQHREETMARQSYSPLKDRQRSIRSSSSKRIVLAVENSKATNKGVSIKRGAQISQQGDSCLSIERNLCQAKENRKLRCQIYLQEESQH